MSSTNAQIRRQFFRNLGKGKQKSPNHRPCGFFSPLTSPGARDRISEMGRTGSWQSWIRRYAPPRVPPRVKIRGTKEYAGVVELADTLDLGSNG